MSESNQNIETICKSKLQITELFYSSEGFIHEKGAEKLVKDEL